MNEYVIRTDRNNLEELGAYPIYGALANLIPGIHGSEGWQILPLGDTIRFRFEADDAVPYLEAIKEGIELNANGVKILTTGGRLYQITPHERLVSSIVILPKAPSLEAFESLIQRRLQDDFGIGPENVHVVGDSIRFLNIKSNRVYGRKVKIQNLTPEQSIAVQARGLGSKLKMGAGFFRGY